MKIAIFCANGIGDFLLMTLVANNAQKEHEVTIFHQNHHLFEHLFPHLKKAHPEKVDLKEFDLILVQNDNSNQAFELAKLRDQGLPIIFLCYKPSPLLKEKDILFSPKKSYIENLSDVSKKFFTHGELTNGIALPNGIYRKYRDRVAIHPMSKDKKRNWPIEKYLKLSLHLESMGFEPIFLMTQTEYEESKSLLTDLNVKPCQTLTELAETLYESAYFIGNDSGPGHLASNLKIPTLTISGNPVHVRIWRPGYYDNQLVTLPFKLPKWTKLGLNIREEYWHYGISTRQVEKAFMHLVGRHSL